jgi:hypothetical protein
VRAALNTKILHDIIGGMLPSKNTLAQYYEPFSLLRCGEGSVIFVSMVTALAGIDFDLNANDVALDTFTERSRSPSNTVLVPINRLSEASISIKAAQQAVAESEAKALEEQNILRAKIETANTGRTSIFGDFFAKVEKQMDIASSALDKTATKLFSSKQQLVQLDVPLSVLVYNPQKCAHAVIDPRLGVPDLVTASLEFLAANIDTPQLFRKVCPEGEVHSLRIVFESEHQIPSHANVHAVSALLILFLRSLPEPVFTYSRFDAFVSCRLIDSVPDQIRNVRLLLNDLPVSHKPTLAAIVRFLKEAAAPEHSERNGCTPSNLTSTFGPELLRPLPVDNDRYGIQEMVPLIVDLPVHPPIP